MVSKQIAAVFAILGGVFYIFGSFVGGVLLGSIFGIADSVRSFSSPLESNAVAKAGDAAAGILVFGIFVGVLIIVGGALLNSDTGSRRKAGGILAIVMMILGAIPDLAGFGIGFVFVLIGSVLGLTYKETSPDLTVGIERATPVFGQQGQRTYSGSTGGQFCIKCGQQLHEGAAFCKYCGSPVPQ